MLYNSKKLLIDAKSLIAELTSEFWAGKRWIILDTSKRMIASDDLKCFFHYDDAAQVCRSNRNDKIAYKVMLLGRLLKVLNNTPKQDLSSSNRRDFLNALEQTSASLCAPLCNYINSIERNDYFPLNKHNVINPLTYVENYHVLGIPWAKNITSNNASGIISKFDIHSSSESFEKSLKDFSDCVLGNSPGRTKYYLIGQFMHKELELNGEGFPVKNTGITLFRSKKTKNGLKLQIDQVNDISSPFVLKHSVFAKFRNETKKLDCYDGGLKKMLFGAVREFMEFKHYIVLPKNRTGS